MQRHLRTIAYSGMFSIFAATMSIAADHSITITANVNGVCTISNIVAGSGTASTTSLNVVTENGTTVASSAGMDFYYSCNEQNVTITLTSENGGITHDSDTSAPKIHYTATTVQGGSGQLLASMDTSNVSSDSESFSATAQPINLNISVPGGVSGLTPGLHEDILRIEINPT